MTTEKYMPVKWKQNLAETDRGLYCNPEEWLEQFFDKKGAFYNGSESGDSDNDDENYNENNEQLKLSQGFSKFYKIFSQFFYKN